MTDVQVIEERERAGGWSFQLRIGAGAAAAKRTLNLSWADYDLWSADGTDPPHAVAAAVIRFLLSKVRPADVPRTLDAATVRRRYAGADEEIPRLI